MKRKKVCTKLCSLLLSVCMLLGLMPAAVFAEGSTPPTDENAWIKLPEACYTQVNTFDISSLENPNHYEGFVITAGTSENAQKNFLYAEATSGNVVIHEVPEEAEVPQLWYWDGYHIYTTVNGTKVYLVSWYVNDQDPATQYYTPANVSVTDYAGNATVWAVEYDDSLKGTVIYRVVNGVKHYLNLSGKWGTFAMLTKQSSTLTAPTVDIYAHRKHEFDSPAGYAALSGSGSYTYAPGTRTAEEILAKIQTDYVVWYDSDTDNEHTDASKVNWDDAHIGYNWDTPLDPNTQGTYNLTISYGVEALGTVTVNIKDAKVTSISITGGKVINTQLHTEPNYSAVKVTAQKEDGTSVNCGDDGHLTFRDEGLDLTATGVYPVEVYHQGTLAGVVFVRVGGDPYSHLVDEGVSAIPEFPAPGAVRWNKTATGINYINTGVAQVELTAAGVSRPRNVDVVLVVDVSNSMGWTMDWFNKTGVNPATAKDPAKIPTQTNGVWGETKLDIAMDSVQEFADILLDNDLGNTLSFVTFAGQNGTTYENGAVKNIDSVKAPFVGVTDSHLAKNSFANTKFTNFVVNGNSVAYTLQIAGTNGQPFTDGEGTASGVNRGNTNYDYAFGQADAVVDQIKSDYAKANNGKAYDDSGRHLYVVFMTDGAPSHYNGYCLTEKTSDIQWGTDSAYTPHNPYTKEAWTGHIQGHNVLAASLAAKVDGFYPVGFDLAHGGFGNFSWDLDTMQDVLEELVSETEPLEVHMAQDAASLHTFFKEIANRIVYAGTSAAVTDTISSDFTLFTGVEADSATQDNLKEITDTGCEITVKRYALYRSTHVGSPSMEDPQKTVTQDMVGQRMKDASGNYSYEVIERVTFNEDGTAAYSDLLHGENILTTENEATTIAAVHFTYTKDAGGKERFDWNIGTITDSEIALSYYAYLKGSMDKIFSNKPENQMYPTNQSAYLDYVDINGRHANRTYPVPKLPWGAASVTVRFYLVNEKGEFVNRAGEVFTEKANRVFLSKTCSYAVQWGDKWEQDVEVAYTDSGITTYPLYDPDSSYTIQHQPAAGTTESTIKPECKTETTSNEEAIKNNLGLLMIWDNDGTLQHSVVEIPVMMTDLGKANSPMGTKKLVIDYGKPVKFGVFIDGEKSGVDIENKRYTPSVVGFAPFDSDHAPVNYVPATAFSPTLHTENGRYEVVNGAEDTIRFTPCTMLDEVEKVFVAVKFVHSETDYYYMYKEVDIIPATIMYYETDFDDDTFKTHGTWETKKEDPTADGPQDAVEIGTDLYGFDSTYANDLRLSNGSSLFSKGESIDGQDPVTYASFDFTGTGFDIIGRTGADQGLIVVTATHHGPLAGESAASAEDGAGAISKAGLVQVAKVLNKSESNLELYQIPVVSMHDLPYGVYTVTVNVIEPFTISTYLGEGASALDRGGEFYFDAVRIYDPIDVSDVPTGGDRQIAYAAYVADGEAHNQIFEIRDQLIAEGTFGNGGSGVVFVDRNQSNVGMAEYTKIGPNNEVYLKKGQAIGFALKIGSVVPASIHIGAKAADGNAVTMTTSVNGNGTAVTKDHPIKTATVQYYDLMTGVTWKAGQTLYIAVTNSGDQVLSITDLKIGYGDTAGTVTLTTDSTAVNAAKALVTGQTN